MTKWTRRGGQVVSKKSKFGHVNKGWVVCKMTTIVHSRGVLRQSKFDKICSTQFMNGPSAFRMSMTLMKNSYVSRSVAVTSEPSESMGKGAIVPPDLNPVPINRILLFLASLTPHIFRPSYSPVRPSIRSHPFMSKRATKRWRNFLFELLSHVKKSIHLRSF